LGTELILRTLVKEKSDASESEIGHQSIMGTPEGSADILLNCPLK
jgi:hypothetical protein